MSNLLCPKCYVVMGFSNVEICDEVLTALATCPDCDLEGDVDINFNESIEGGPQR
jgi:hypothetical protein